MKKIVLLILALNFLSIHLIMAQQLPNVSYFMYDHGRTNPGSLGSKDMVCATLIGKSMMQGFAGAPQSVFASAEVPFKLFGAKHGVGLTFMNDALGFQNDFSLNIGYAFRFSVAEGTLGIGVNANIYQHSLVDVKWQYGENGDPSDPYIPSGNQENINAFGFGAGLFYRSEDIYFGASVTNISSGLDYEVSEGATSGGSAVLNLKPHYFVTAGYTIQLSNPAYEIDPQVLFYSDGVSTTFDINGTLTYNKRVWAGVSYRTGTPASAIVGMAGLVIFDGLKVGYAYDYNASALSTVSSGGHEVLLNYCFKIGVEKSPQRYRSIRYL